MLCRERNTLDFTTLGTGTLRICSAECRISTGLQREKDCIFYRKYIFASAFSVFLTSGACVFQNKACSFSELYKSQKDILALNIAFLVLFLEILCYHDRTSHIALWKNLLNSILLVLFMGQNRKTEIFLRHFLCSAPYQNI